MHRTKHKFVFQGLERGVSLTALQQILGHARVIKTQSYARLSDHGVRREAGRIEGGAGCGR